MKFRIASLALAGAAVLAMGSNANAGSTEPGSLLVYPCFINVPGVYTLLSVANTSGDVANGTVKVEIVYINGETCLETNRERTLTAKDLYAVLTYYHNPNYEYGYAYAFAKDRITGQAIAWDYLIGDNWIYSAFGSEPLGFGDPCDGAGGSPDCDNSGALAVEVMPFTFKAGTMRNGQPWPDGTATDVDSDGIRDLNGREYEQAPDEILVPLFLGNNFNFHSNGIDGHGGSHVPTVLGGLVLISLTGAQHETIIDFDIYNDNEEHFSAQWQFDCWDKVPLLAINAVFDNYFLQGTDQDDTEVQGLNDLESGWYEMDGLIAFANDQVNDPAFLAVQFQFAGGGLTASRPYQRGHQRNGDLLVLGPFADPN